MYQKMKVHMKSQRYEWPDKYYKNNQKGQAPLIPDLPENADTGQKTCVTKYEKDESVNR